MSNIVPINNSEDWAPPEVMQFYRDEVKKRGEEWLAAHPTAKHRAELRCPEECAKAIYLLTESGLKDREVAQQTGIREIELGRLIYHRPELWEKRRPKLAQKLAIASEMLADAMQKKAQKLLEDPEELAKTPVKDLALALGITTDKAAAYHGMATTVVEHRTGASLDDAAAAIAAAKARARGRIIEAEIVP